MELKVEMLKEQESEDLVRQTRQEQDPRYSYMVVKLSIVPAV